VAQLAEPNSASVRVVRKSGRLRVISHHDALTPPHQDVSAAVFGGRFQARFETDGFYNNPRGTSAGWNFAQEGEPDFVPADSVATAIDKPVGRVDNFNNPVVPVRPHVAPIGVKVTAIKGTAGAASMEFTKGDPIIGLPVNLGPHTYLAPNVSQKFAPPPVSSGIS